MPTSSSAETPGWSPVPTPATYGPVTVVEGISVFVSGNVGTITGDPDGTQQARGGSFVFRDEMNDPRVSGVHTAANFSMDRWGDAAGNDALVQWGDSKIVNDDGTWVGRSSGVYSAERGDLIVAWYEGTGGYEGLSYFFMSDSLDITAGFTSVWRVRGQIFPGDPPPP